MSSDKKIFKILIIGDVIAARTFIQKYCERHIAMDSYWKIITNFYEFYFSYTISSINDLKEKKEIYDAAIFFSSKELFIHEWINAFYEKHHIDTPFIECSIDHIIPHVPPRKEYINYFCVNGNTNEYIKGIFVTLGDYLCKYRNQKNEISGYVMETEQTRIEQKQIETIPKEDNNYISDLFSAYKKCESTKMRFTIEELIINSVIHESLDKYKNEFMTEDNKHMFEKITGKYGSFNLKLDFE